MVVIAAAVGVLVAAGVAIVIATSGDDAPREPAPTPPRATVAEYDPDAEYRTAYQRAQTTAAPILARLREISTKAQSLELAPLREPLQLAALRENDYSTRPDAFVVGDDVAIDHPANSWTERIWMSGQVGHAFELLAGTKRPGLPYELDSAVGALSSVEYVLIVRAIARTEPTLDPNHKTFTAGTIRAEVRVFRMRDGEYMGGVPFVATSSPMVEARDFVTDLDDDLRLAVRKALREALAAPR